MKVPKQKAKKGAPSKPHEPLDARDLADVQPMIEQLGVIVAHVREAWYDDEVEDGLKRLHEARAQLELFRRLASGHYDRVLSEL